ncbi:zinc-finger associated domain (zf-AD) domain-containing protein [Phthorimaea operculella]|nr:zinc-finger associated domain (zf-AD) domain-containing protein [Phthorimaea operculella]
MANSVSPNVSRTIIRPECRVCLKQDGQLPIFGDATKPDISMEISQFGAVQLQENDGLPKYICENCFKLLEGAITFRKLAKRSDALLKRRKKKEEQEQAQTSSSAVVENVAYEVRVLVPVNSENLENSHEYYLNQGANNINFVSVDVEQTPFEEIYLGNEEVLDNTYHENLETVVDRNEHVLQEKTPDESTTANLYNCKYCNLGFNTSDEYEEHRTTVQHKRNYVMSFLPKKRTRQPGQARKTASPRDHFFPTKCAYHPTQVASTDMRVI